jgi:hypothetical protein
MFTYLSKSTFADYTKKLEMVEFHCRQKSVSEHFNVAKVDGISDVRPGINPGQGRQTLRTRPRPSHKIPLASH